MFAGAIDRIIDDRRRADQGGNLGIVGESFSFDRSGAWYPSAASYTCSLEGKYMYVYADDVCPHLRPSLPSVRPSHHARITPSRAVHVGRCSWEWSGLGCIRYVKTLGRDERVE